jgi:hypothetical protein
MRIGTQEYPEMGDTLRVLGRLNIYHWGTYVGPCGRNGEDVVAADKDGGQVRLTHFSEFAGRRPDLVEIVERAHSPEEAVEIARRALSRLGTRYDLLAWNCETQANFARSAIGASPTVRLLTIGAFILAAWWWGQRKN